jgi:hypothetical protein
MCPERAEKKNKIERCADFLRNFHKEYASPSSEIEVAAQAAGFTSDNLTDARALIPELQKSNDGFQGVWWWGIGDPSKWKRRPEPTSSEPHNSPDTPNSPKTPKTPNNGNPKAFSKFGDSGKLGNLGESRTNGKHPDSKMPTVLERLRNVRIPPNDSN